MQLSNATPAGLGEYVRVLRRRKRTVVLTVLLVVGSALGASAAQTPVYEGTAEVLLQPGSSSEFLFREQRSTTAVQTEIRVLKSAPVREAVSDELGVEAPEVDASPIPQTEVFEVKARHPDPEEAAAIANAYVNAYIEYRRSQAVEDLVAAGAGLQAQIDELQRQIDGLTQQIASAVGESEREAVERNLGPQRDALVSQQGLLKQSLDQLQVSTPLVTGGAQLVNPATPPSDPVEPKPVRNGLVGLGAGLVLGVGLVFVFDRLDDTIRGTEDLARATPDIPVIGLIPLVTNWRRRSDARLISSTDPTSPVAEAYRSLRTSISFLGIDQDIRTVQVTSPSVSEGKSTTVANLALTLSRAGQRVMVLSCDLRRPRVHDFFGLPNDVGFTTVLLGDASVSEAVQKVPGEHNLSVLVSGPVPPNPSELLSSNRTLEVLTALQSRADVVLIDSAPVLPVTDAIVLAARGYPTLLIASVGRTTRKRLGRSVDLLRQVDGAIVGTVLNGVGGDDEMTYGYGYSYEQKTTRRRRRFRRRAETGQALPPPAPPVPTTSRPSELGDSLFGRKSEAAQHGSGPIKMQGGSGGVTGNGATKDSAGSPGRPGSPNRPADSAGGRNSRGGGTASQRGRGKKRKV